MVDYREINIQMLRFCNSTLLISKCVFQWQDFNISPTCPLYISPCIINTRIGKSGPEAVYRTMRIDRKSHSQNFNGSPTQIVAEK